MNMALHVQDEAEDLRFLCDVHGNSHRLFCLPAAWYMDMAPGAQDKAKDLRFLCDVHMMCGVSHPNSIFLLPAAWYMDMAPRAQDEDVCTWTFKP